MKILLYLLETDTYNKHVLGDEILANGLKEGLLKQPDVELVDIKSPYNYKNEKYDLAINFHFHGAVIDKPPIADINTLWFQAVVHYIDKIDKRRYNKIFSAFKNWHIKNPESIYLPMATDPHVFFPIENEKYENDIVFIGNKSLRPEETYRRYLYPLFGRFKVRVYGNSWMGRIPMEIYGGLINPLNIPDVYSKSKIVLAICSDQHRKYDGFTDRLPNALACEKTIICDMVPSAMDYFADCVYFQKPEDCIVTTVDHILKNTEDFSNKYGRKKILESHTLEHRAKQIMEEIKCI